MTFFINLIKHEYSKKLDCLGGLYPEDVKGVK